MPVAGHHHVLDGALLAVRQLHPNLGFLRALARLLPADLALLLRAFAWAHPADLARLRRSHLAHARMACRMSRKLPDRAVPRPIPDR